MAKSVPAPKPAETSKPQLSLDLAAAQPTDYLIFIGGNFYPTIDSFVNEAEELGISRRMPSHKLPTGLVMGRSRVYLAHAGTKANDLAKAPVFGYFTPQRVEYIATDEGFDADVVAELKMRSDSRIVGSIQGEAQRGCGFRKSGGTYLVVDKAESPLMLLPSLPNYVGHHFRGMRALTPEEATALNEGRSIGQMYHTHCDECGANVAVARDGFDRQQREQRRFDKTGERKWVLRCPACVSKHRKHNHETNQQADETIPSGTEVQHG